MNINLAIKKSTKILKDKFYRNSLKGLSFNHRGYCIYQLKKSSLGSIVHGNFGGISVNRNISLNARLRSTEYRYTPPYLFENQNLYHSKIVK